MTSIGITVEDLLEQLADLPRHHQVYLRVPDKEDDDFSYRAVFGVSRGDRACVLLDVEAPDYDGDQA